MSLPKSEAISLSIYFIWLVLQLSYLCCEFEIDTIVVSVPEVGEDIIDMIGQDINILFVQVQKVFTSFNLEQFRIIFFGLFLLKNNQVTPELNNLDPDISDNTEESNNKESDNKGDNSDKDNSKDADYQK